MYPSSYLYFNSKNVHNPVYWHNGSAYQMMPYSQHTRPVFQPHIRSNIQPIIHPDIKPTYQVKKKAGLTGPSSVKVPCATKTGALRDYFLIVLGYKSYSGPNCWRKLPTEIKERHTKFIKDLFSDSQTSDLLIDELGEVVNCGITRSITGKSGIKFPCLTESSAIKDYYNVVAMYEKYSGRGCWRFLPEPVKTKHNELVASIKNLEVVKNLISKVNLGGYKQYKTY